VLAEMFPQCVAHRTERLVDVGVVGFAADDEENVGLLEPVLVTDACDLLHLRVGRIAAEIRGDDRGLAEHLRHQGVRAAAKSRSEDCAVRIDDEDVGLALVRPQLIDFVLEVGSVGSKQVIRKVEALPARVVPIEAALEVASDRRQPPFRAASISADRA
jgi:hypothetical protein